MEKDERGIFQHRESAANVIHRYTGNVVEIRFAYFPFFMLGLVQP